MDKHIVKKVDFKLPLGSGYVVDGDAGFAVYPPSVTMGEARTLYENGVFSAPEHSYKPGKYYMPVEVVGFHEESCFPVHIIFNDGTDKRKDEYLMDIPGLLFTESEVALMYERARTQIPVSWVKDYIEKENISQKSKNSILTMLDRWEAKHPTWENITMEWLNEYLEGTDMDDEARSSIPIMAGIYGFIQTVKQAH